MTVLVILLFICGHRPSRSPHIHPAISTVSLLSIVSFIWVQLRGNARFVAFCGLRDAHVASDLPSHLCPGVELGVHFPDEALGRYQRLRALTVSTGSPQPCAILSQDITMRYAGGREHLPAFSLEM